MLRRVALERTDVSGEFSASFIRVTRIVELGTTLAVTSNRRTASVVPSSPILVFLLKEALSFSETSVPTRTTRRNNPEYAVLHSLRRENLKSCSIFLFGGEFLSSGHVYFHLFGLPKKKHEN
jgi:hypothetical protein